MKAILSSLVTIPQDSWFSIAIPADLPSASSV